MTVLHTTKGVTCQVSGSNACAYPVIIGPKGLQAGFEDYVMRPSSLFSQELQRGQCRLGQGG